MSMSQYYGEIHECPNCKASANAADMPERSCTLCYGRLFVAECTNCYNKGYVEQPVAGSAAGSMKATCSACGGKRFFAVNKPDGWVAPEPEKKALATA